MEKELNFMGLLVLENKLKPVTRGIIETLKSSNIHCIMIIGDNALTAISVARDASLVDANEKVYLLELETNQFGRKFINC